MGIFKAVKCDICNRTSTDAKHWLVVGFDDANITIERLFLEAYESLESDLLVCSTDCMQKAVQNLIPKLYQKGGHDD